MHEAVHRHLIEVTVGLSRHHDLQYSLDKLYSFFVQSLSLHKVTTINHLSVSELHSVCDVEEAQLAVADLYTKLPLYQVHSLKQILASP